MVFADIEVSAGSCFCENRRSIVQVQVLGCASHGFHQRQRKVLNMLFDGFEGKLNSSKWYRINHCSQDTANRDIKDLIAKGILRPTGEGGRSTNYELVFP